jgi:hypothetical protein
MEHKTTHEEEALSRLLEQYREKPNISGLISSMASEAQALEDSIWTTHTETLIETAEGAQLDQIGAVVGQARQGMDDATYRVWILARIKLNNTSGSPGEIIDIFRPLLPAGAVMSLVEFFPASFSLRLSGMPYLAELASILVRMLRSAKAAAIRAFLEWQDRADAAVFSFEAGPGLGFGDAGDPATGGGLIGAMT